MQVNDLININLQLADFAFSLVADYSADGVTKQAADLAVCHDRPRSDSLHHSPQHLCGQVADPHPLPSCTTH